MLIVEVHEVSLTPHPDHAEGVKCKAVGNAHGSPSQQAAALKGQN